MDKIISRHKNIGVLVNNAGVTADGLFMMMPEERLGSGDSNNPERLL